MKAILFALSVLLVGGAAHARECGSGFGEILKLTDWSAVAKNGRATDVSFTLENVTKRTVQMVDGTVWFEDTLGQSIGGVSITPDVALAPGAKFDQTSFMAGFERLVKARKADISAVACLAAVVYEDRTKEEFK